jgi:hypothetical protein
VLTLGVSDRHRAKFTRNRARAGPFLHPNAR